MRIFNMKYLWTALFWLLTVPSNAHAIWIETNTEAKVGDWHEVRVFFGEPNETNKRSILLCEFQGRRRGCLYTQHQPSSR